jgi:predicted metallo-beta-lactamase superfamily hydrolase
MGVRSLATFVDMCGVPVGIDLIKGEDGVR